MIEKIPYSNEFLANPMNIIVACDMNGLIGVGPKIPWHIPADFKYFKAMTEGHFVIMGRKTYESIGKPLPNRYNIVVSRSAIANKAGIVENYGYPPGVRVVGDIDTAIALADMIYYSYINKEINLPYTLVDGAIFIIGGGEIYKQTMDHADNIYVTEVDVEVPIPVDMQDSAVYVDIPDDFVQDFKTEDYVCPKSQLTYRFTRYARPG